MKNRKSLKGVPDLRFGKKPEHSERMKEIYAWKQGRHEGLNSVRHQRGDTALLLEIARESALEFSDDQFSYVTVQMDKTTWTKLQARASRI